MPRPSRRKPPNWARISVAMTTDPAPVNEGTAPTPSTLRVRGPAFLLVAEDWLLALWVAVASPVLFRLQGGQGPFDSGAPLLGALRLFAVLGALVCLAARRQPRAARQGGTSILQSGAVGPLCGGILLVTISGVAALDLPEHGGEALVLAALIAMIVVHFAVPPLGMAVRRALVTPFVLVSGGLFWTFIAAISGEPGSATPAAAIANPQTAAAAAGFLIAFSGVFYAMLIYAPRQVAEREGGLVTWCVRYTLFVAGIVAGLAWPRILGL
jgi:hypothetical protein